MSAQPVLCVHDSGGGDDRERVGGRFVECAILFGVVGLPAKRLPERLSLRVVALQSSRDTEKLGTPAACLPHQWSSDPRRDARVST